MRPLADLDCFLQWYDVTGVCFDRVSVGAEHLGYYAALSRDARDVGARVVLFNHGAHPLEAYAEHADLLGTFEGPVARLPAAGRAALDPVPARPDLLPRRVLGTAGEFDHAFLLAIRRRAGSVYITDRGGANPYDGLPAGGLAAGVSRGCV